MQKLLLNFIRIILIMTSVVKTRHVRQSRHLIGLMYSYTITDQSLSKLKYR